jgi:hypothetical protein
VVAAKGDGVLAIDVGGGPGLLEGAWERDAQVGVLALAGAVHHAAHHRHLHDRDDTAAQLAAIRPVPDFVRAKAAADAY